MGTKVLQENNKTNNLIELITFLLIVIFNLTSCKTQNNHIKETLVDKKPIVLTTFTVLADISRNIAGDRLDVKSVTKEGMEIHTYQPTPSDLVRATEADLIVENGLGLELWAEKFTSVAGDVPKVVLSKGMTPIFISGDKSKGKPNPHAWMSPQRAKYYVDELVQAFIEIDPDGREIFIKNGLLYKQQLQTLDQDLRKMLNSIPTKQRILVSCEGAFSYLAQDYGMEEAYLWPVNSESQVTPKRMLNLIEIVKNRQVPSIFCESTVSSKAQREVARMSGARFGGTFYVDSLSKGNGPASNFLDMQRHNVQLLKKGLSQTLLKE